MSGHSTIKAWLVECCRDGCPSGRFSHLHRGTLELCQSDHQVLGHLSDQLVTSLCLDTVLSLTSMGQFIPPHGLIFFSDMLCQLWNLSYRQVCAFPNHDQSIECTTGGLQSSYRNISRMINGNRMHLSSISSLIAKGLNTYVKKTSLFFSQTILENCFCFLVLGYCV